MSFEHTALIAPLGAAGRADEIALRISEAIQLGLLSDGEKLPPELDFAQQFGVSPVTLREAIATLRDRGLVETRRGRHGGTFVRRLAEPDEAPDVARLRDLSATELRDMFDEHGAVASMTARLAAQRAASSNIRRIGSLAEQLGSETTRGARMKADSRFHIEVAIATRSERLTRREVALQAEVASLLWISRLPESEIEDIGKEHRAIADCIAAENAEEAGRMAESHMRACMRRLAAMHLALTSQTRRPT